MKGAEIEKIADNMPKGLKGNKVTEYLLERTFTKEQIEFICQECDIGSKELFAMTPSEIDQNVVERMLDIESELETDDKGKDIANERVDKAGNILDVFSHW